VQRDVAMLQARGRKEVGASAREREREKERERDTEGSKGICEDEDEDRNAVLCCRYNTPEFVARVCRDTRQSPCS
jgi:hypothetical protein